ncbi:MAG: hypothetical protein HYU36_22260 [Planctomycetes bacterium]|nr:hypothetical protein [Planctomycetota bacterium]
MKPKSAGLAFLLAGLCFLAIFRVWAGDSEKSKAEDIDPRGKRSVVGDDYGWIHIHYEKGKWLVHWSSRMDEKIEWQGRVVAEDGTWVKFDTRSFEENKPGKKKEKETNGEGKEAADAALPDRAQKRENELRFASLSAGKADGLVLVTDGTKLYFDIFADGKRVPSKRVFIGGTMANPSKVPFVLQAPADRSDKRKSSL